MSLSQRIGWRRVVPLVGLVVALGCVMPVDRAAGESRLTVDYDARGLSVEAREVSLPVLLKAIGAKVGFSVVEAAPSSGVVSLSIRDASLDDVLRQLLREENHTVLYRAGAGGTAEPAVSVDTIVLLGQPGTASPALAGRDQVQDRRAPAGGYPSSPAVPSAISTASPPQPLLDLAPLISRGGALAPGSTGDPGAPPVTVGDLLKAHAMGSLPSTSATGPAAATGPGSLSAPPPRLEATLAETTRRAQQALGALIEGLATATESLRRAQSAGQR